MRLSVVIANYNHGHYLKERLQSILDQMDDAMEIIVVDDASTDQSLSILQGIANQDDRVKILINATNQGAMRSANRAMCAASGTYVLSVSADDVLFPGYIHHLLSILEANPHISLCCSDYATFDSVKSKLFRLIPGATRDKVFTKPDEVAKIMKEKHFAIPGITSMIKREALIRRGCLDTSLESSGDWFLLNTMALEEGFAYVPKIYASIRLCDHSYNRTMKKDHTKRNQMYLKILDRLQTNRALCTQFKRADLLEHYIDRLFWPLIFKPRYWHFHLSLFPNYYIKKMSRLIGIKR